MPDNIVHYWPINGVEPENMHFIGYPDSINSVRFSFLSFPKRVGQDVNEPQASLPTTPAIPVPKAPPRLSAHTLRAVIIICDYSFNRVAIPPPLLCEQKRKCSLKLYQVKNQLQMKYL